MASNDPGLAPVTRPAEDPRIPRKDGSISMQAESRSPSLDGERKELAAGDEPIAPDQFDPNFETGKWELWSYYVCASRLLRNRSVLRSAKKIT